MLFGKKNKYTQTDEELVALYVNTSDKKYIGVLFERYSYMVLGVCYKYLKNKEESRDAVITIFEKLFMALKEQHIDTFRPWLHTVARNYCLMQLRKKKLPEAEKDIIDLAEKINDAEEEKQYTEENLQKLEIAINQLKPRQKRCIELFYLQQFSYADVAAQTGYSLKEVKSYLQNAKRNLINILSNLP
jgi:RNA polymerase sigma-70 factor (ECF subfamily)